MAYQRIPYHHLLAYLIQCLILSLISSGFAGFELQFKILSFKARSNTKIFHHFNFIIFDHINKSIYLIHLFNSILNLKQLITLINFKLLHYDYNYQNLFVLNNFIHYEFKSNFLILYCYSIMRYYLIHQYFIFLLHILILLIHIIILKIHLF